MNRFDEAKTHYLDAMQRVATTPEPKGQKFPIGTRVRIAKNLGPHMEHFSDNINATVKYTHAHAYGGDDITYYLLDIDGYDVMSWYDEHQLTALEV